VAECGTCPPTQCLDKGQLQVTATNYNAQNDNKQTALVAGLTTGLVVIALIAATVAGFVFYRRRKLQKLLQQKQLQDEKDSTPPIIISDIHTVLPPPLPTAWPQVKKKIIEGTLRNHQLIKGSRLLNTIIHSRHSLSVLNLSRFRTLTHPIRQPVFVDHLILSQPQLFQKPT
jgi:hypothetical protein